MSFMQFVYPFFTCILFAACKLIDFGPPLLPCGKFEFENANNTLVRYFSSVAYFLLLNKTLNNFNFIL